ncbi:MAG TPA: YXWGXW repeat-containing protein [Candidatus Eisenbacteria bacterium]|nr:YXWGXW repeat-containing protein [Candidatus Eisenbacteria bacterium]
MKMQKKFWMRCFLAAMAMLAVSPITFGQVNVGISVSFGPPALPVYTQPLCPGDGYMWTPGYWAWDGYDYYWVPGTWVLIPEPGFFWTPPWWGWGGRGYIFHSGYWGPRVGFYGGINYGFGYFGHGYEGGRWDRGHFFYNRSVNNLNVTEIHNVYNTTVVKNYGNSHVSYNGGRGGLDARPTAEEQAAIHDRHIPPIPSQVQHMEASRENTSLRSAVNRGRPPIAATSRPGAFKEPGVVKATEAGHYNPPRTEHSVGYPGSAVHPKDLPANSRMNAPSSGNPKEDKSYQQEQEKLYTKQAQERQQLQQKQEQEHQRYSQQQAGQQQMQQLERQHQQQTQQLAQHHYQQQVQLSEHQQSHPSSQPPPKHKP